MDARLLFPSLYIGAADLRGRDAHLTISRVVQDDLKTDRGTEKKPVIYFREMEARKRAGKGEDKRLVMNKTNMKAIGKALGTYETDEWVGGRITLYPTTCVAFGQVVDCVRVRDVAAPPPRNRKPEPKPEPEPEPSPLFDDEEPPFGALESDRAAE